MRGSGRKPRFTQRRLTMPASLAAVCQHLSFFSPQHRTISGFSQDPVNVLQRENRHIPDEIFCDSGNELSVLSESRRSRAGAYLGKVGIVGLLASLPAYFTSESCPYSYMVQAPTCQSLGAVDVVRHGRVFIPLCRFSTSHPPFGTQAQLNSHSWRDSRYAPSHPTEGSTCVGARTSTSAARWQVGATPMKVW